MPPLTDRRIDELFRAALDERADALMPGTITAQEMAARLESAVARRQTRRQVVWLLLAAALLLGLAFAALGVGGGLVKQAVVPFITPSASPSLSASPFGTPSATPTPSSAAPTPQSAVLTVSKWHEVDPNPLANMGLPYAPVWSGSRFIIAGYPMIHPTPTPDDRGFAPDNVVFLTSPDGQTWSQGPQSNGNPLAYAFDGSAGVAVGSDGNQAAVWTSPDSVTWTRLQNPPALTLSGRETQMPVNDIAHGPAGYVALANPGNDNGDQPLVLWSPDGRDWQRLPMGPFQSNGASTELGNVVVVGGRYVISGRVNVPVSADAPASVDPTLWTSTDGRDWTKEPALQDGPDIFLELVAGPAGALLTGIEPDPAGGDRCVAWRSSDGIAWTRTADDCPRLLGSPGLVATPFGFVAFTPHPIVLGGPLLNPSPGAGSHGPTATPELPCAGGVEVSTAGDHWVCVPPPSSVDLGAPGDIVAASPTELLGIGSTRQTAANPTGLGVWIAAVQGGQ